MSEYDLDMVDDMVVANQSEKHIQNSHLFTKHFSLQDLMQGISSYVDTDYIMCC